MLFLPYLGVQQSHSGPCTDLTRPEECPFTCPDHDEEEDPDSVVCGSDGNAYSSECQLRLKTCGQRVTVANKKNCQATKYEIKYIFVREIIECIYV